MKKLNNLSTSFFVMIRIIALSFIVIGITRLAALGAENEERLGKIYLRSGEQIEGVIKANLANNYLMVQLDSVTRAYNAWQVGLFTLLDPYSLTYQTFYSLSYQDRGKKAFWFFEVVQEGHLTLLKRNPDLTLASLLADSYGYMRDAQQQEDKKSEYYVWDNRDQIIRFYGRKKELLKLMHDEAEKIEGFISRYRLSLTDKDDLKTIFGYYNTLKTPQPKKQPKVIPPPTIFTKDPEGQMGSKFGKG
jgi:hypothetical protein